MEHLPEALYCAADIRAADRRAAMHFNLAGTVLMERAGAAGLALLRERFPRARRIAVVCGPGNNGGDGYVLARLAARAGLDVQVMSPAPAAPAVGDAADASALWHEAGGRILDLDPAALAASDVIVDALFGTGLVRPLEAAWRAAVEAMNTAGVPILALDLPSGLQADTGQVPGVAVRARLTLSFIGLKPGLLTGAGREQCGTILLNDLGVPPGVFEGLRPMARRLTRRNLRGLLAARTRHAHKGDVGRLLIIGGQPGMPGAARLAGEAACRSGAGLVTVATHPSHAAILGATRPEMIVHGVDASGLAGLLPRLRAVAIGPGLGQAPWGQAMWEAALATDLPMAVDADALSWLAARPQYRSHWVLTPHPGEAARLLATTIAAVQADRFAAARAIADRYGGVCVLKGSGTLVASAGEETIWLCDRGNPGMASGGSGDVLTGVIAALLAQELSLLSAARLGVWAHASAGDRAARAGERGMLASDLLDPLRDIMNELANAD